MIMSCLRPSLEHMKFWFVFVLISICSATTLAKEPPANVRKFILENQFLKRTFIVDQQKVFKTEQVVNKVLNQPLQLLKTPEFRLRLSEGTDSTGTDRVLNNRDFIYQNRQSIADDNGRSLIVHLKGKDGIVGLKIHYQLNNDEPFLRKRLTINFLKDICLERIDVDVLEIDDAWQPYKVKAINARGKWSPGLGQPLFTRKTATFWGVEFPAADNHVEDKTMICGYLNGRKWKAGSTHISYTSILGVGDDPAFISDSFLDHINQTRIRPLRLQIQYNSWFDFAQGVNKNNFKKSIEMIHNELVNKRKNKALKAYVIDSGWQDKSHKADWTKKTWTVNKKFDPDFKTSLDSTRQADSSLGVWVSPGCLFGVEPMVEKYRKAGFEALDPWMSIAGPKYMGLLKKRLVELTSMGITYFKLDGIFGHLNKRNFELEGHKYGLPSIPQLIDETFKPDSLRLNDHKFDELKIYYLTAGAEKLIDMFAAMAEVNPDVYIVISNGAWLSPWWLYHADSVWMINAGDAAKGSNRTRELTYRDGVYHEIYAIENTQFPMNALFNHEPKKVKTGESDDVFRKYLYLNISRGTGFIELYIKTYLLSQSDWDVLSEGLHWSYAVFPAFTHARMHGGNPRKNEVYGYAGFTSELGYLSIHNPARETRNYTITFDRRLGLRKGIKPMHVSSPIDNPVVSDDTIKYGDERTYTIKAGDILILNFNTEKRSWEQLKRLQKSAKTTAKAN